MSILGDLASVSNPYGSPSQGEWNLSRMVYTNQNVPNGLVLYYVDRTDEPQQSRTGLSQISDKGGRRLAAFNYPYKDGTAYKDLGRMGESFDFDLKFFGLYYQTQLNLFIDNVLKYSGVGTLIHPVRGAFSVQLETYEFIHKYDEWNAVTVRCTFKEDASVQLEQANSQAASSDSVLRSALKTLTSAQAAISGLISDVGAVLLLPNAIKQALQNRLASIVTLTSSVLGQLAATFSSNQTLQHLAAQAAAVNNSIPSLNNGTTKKTLGGSTALSQLPPVYQTGLDAQTMALINSQTNSFVNANQISTQQAVYSTNQARAQITVAISEIETQMGNDGYDIINTYRGLANALQEAAEAAIASQQSLIVQYTVPYGMSLRKIAQNNGLAPDRQNDIEALNPYLASVNFVPQGTVVVVPAA
jgi:prophage DNA circulation protein